MEELGWRLRLRDSRAQVLLLSPVWLAESIYEVECCVRHFKKWVSPSVKILWKECRVNVSVIYFGFYTGIIAIHTSQCFVH